MKKVLYVATSDIHINLFHIPYLKWLKNNKCEVHLAIENRANVQIPYIDKLFYLPFPRSPLNRLNYSSYQEMKSIINKNEYDLIHCHTPVPSVITRLAARYARIKGTKVLYTAHGFHFFNRAPVSNWIIYYPIEYFLSAFTDAIITMNTEDFNHVNCKMRHKRTYLIPGMGVDPETYKPISLEKKNSLRKKLGYDPNSIILIYIAEFIPRKNHKLIIHALELIRNHTTNLKVIFAGKGILLKKMEMYVEEKGVSDIIDFLGFRNDIPELTAISDIGISASKQEGLPIGILQEMFCGLPIVASMERGHNELITNGVNGFLFSQDDTNGLADTLLLLINNHSLRLEMGQKSFEIAGKFSLNNSLESMINIYNQYLN